MIRQKITIEELDNKNNAHATLALGLALDNPEGLHMARTGGELVWVAVQGEIGDWCVYTHFSSHDIEFIKSQGDKVVDRRNIDNILDITDEVWARYRL